MRIRRWERGAEWRKEGKPGKEREEGKLRREGEEGEGFGKGRDEERVGERRTAAEAGGGLCLMANRPEQRLACGARD